MKKIVVLLTACLLLIGMTISIAAQTTTYANTPDYEDLDYSENLKKAGSIYMGEVLDALTDVSVSDAEKAYIRYKFEGQNALYYSKPAVSGMQFDYDGETEVLTLLVNAYYYVSSRGQDILWVPNTVRCGDSAAKFEPAPDVGPSSYRVVLEDVTWSANVMLVLEYCADFRVTSDSLNAFTNFAYEQALLLDEEYASFEIEKGIYDAALAEYQEIRALWDQYEAACDKHDLYLYSLDLYADYLKYQDFLALVDVYEKKHALYQENLLAWQNYEKQYNEYLNYVAYQTEYPLLLKKYTQAMAFANNQIVLLSYLEKPDAMTGASFIDMMLDDRIGGLIASKQEQIALVVGKAPVDEIIESTDVLQRFCRTYKTLATDQEKYAYYVREYASFSKHLRQLYDNIQKVYNNNTLYKILQEEYPDKIGSLVRLLGMLYVHNCLFNDNIHLNIGTIVDKRGNQTAGQLVSASVYPEKDTNQATPLAEWPKAPVSPDSFAIKEQPQAPAYTLQKPAYPSLPEFTLVENVDEIPAHMEEPQEVVLPQEPAEKPVHPGPAPSLPWDTVQKDLHQDYCEGKIVQRENYSADQTVNLSVSINHTIKLDSEDRRYFVHFYNTDEQGTYLGHTPTGVYYGEPATIPPEFAYATKPPVNEWAYEFAGWVDEDGMPLDISCMTADVNAYASYKTVPRVCTVTWNVGDAPVVQHYAYGQMPSYNGSVEKSSDAQYVYTAFLGWDKEIVPVTDDVTYTAVYSMTLQRYMVTFVMSDGTRVEKEYTYGWNLADVVAALPVPYKPADARFTYKFVGWSDGSGNLYTDSTRFPKLTGPVTYTPEFEQTLNTYTVTWVVDGEAIQTTWKYGDLPTFGATAGSVPTKPDDERWTYDFTNWDKQIEPVTGDVTYTAEFTASVRYYAITFVVEGTEYSYTVAYEKLPVFEGTPHKDSDVKYDYAFIGWDKEPVPAREDAIYVAEFGKVVRKYPVRFVVGGTEVIADFEYGTVPKYPNGTPAKSDDAVYRYVFSSWDREIAAVDGGAVTYTAQFTSVPLAPGANGDKGTLSAGENGRFELKLDGARADLSLVFDKVGEAQADVLEVLFGKAVLVFPKSQIEAFYLMGNGIGSVTLAPAEHDGHAAYTLELLDVAGVPVSYLVTELTVKLPYQGAHTADVYQLNPDGTQTQLQAQHVDGYLVFSAMEQSTFVIVDKFLIEKTAAENGVFDVVGEAYEGEVITINPNPDEGYHVDRVLVECDGKQIEVAQTDGKYTFVMPNGNVHVTTTFKVVEGGTGAEVVVGVVTALLIVAIGFVVAIVLRKKRTVKI